MNKVLFLLSLLFIVLVTYPCYAFRCGEEPIGLWDKKEKVLKYCGYTYEVGQLRVYHLNKYIHAETFYYNCGEQDFVYAVSFYNNIVIRDEPIKRGSGLSKCSR